MPRSPKRCRRASARRYLQKMRKTSKGRVLLLLDRLPAEEQEEVLYELGDKVRDRIVNRATGSRREQ